MSINWQSKCDPSSCAKFINNHCRGFDSYGEKYSGDGVIILLDPHLARFSKSVNGKCRKNPIQIRLLKKGPILLRFFSILFTSLYSVSFIAKLQFIYPIRFFVLLHYFINWTSMYACIKRFFYFRNCEAWKLFYCVFLF